MKYKAYIDYDGTGYKEFEPDILNSFSIVRQAVQTDGSIEQFFYRINWGELTISNKPNLFKISNSSVHKLYNILNDIDFSTKVLIKVTTQLKTFYGYFRKNDCNFNDDRKILTVTPSVIDGYTDIFENIDSDVDFTNYVFDKVPIKIKMDSSLIKTIEDWPTNSPYKLGFSDIVLFNNTKTYPRNRIKENDYQDNGGLSLYFDNGKPKQTLFQDSYYGFITNNEIYDFNQPLTIGPFWLQGRVDALGQMLSSNADDENYGPNVDIHYGDFELSRFRVYEGTRTGGLSGKRWRNLYCQTWFSRDEFIKVDESDSDLPYGYKPPVGDGWNMRQQTVKDGKPAHIWTRKPFNGAYSEQWEIQPEVLNDGTDSSYNFSWNKYLESRIAYDDSENSLELVSSIKLNDFLNHLVKNSDTSLSLREVKSTFFFNDFEDQIPYLKNTTGINYVTGEKNHLNNVRLFFTRDLLPSEDNVIKKIPKYTINDIFNDLNKLFCGTLIWFVDSNNYIRIEHKKFSDLIGGFKDIRTNESIFDTNQYSYDKSMMFEIFKYTQFNSGYPDFIDNKIEYNKIVSNNRNKDKNIEFKTEIFSTDIKYAIQNPASVSDGIIFLCLDSNNVVTSKQCDLIGAVEVNGFVSTSNILKDFATYEGLTNVGLVNSIPRSFATTQRCKIGIDIMLKGSQDSLFYTTQVGYGLIESGKIDLENQTTTIKLRYRIKSNTTIGNSISIGFSVSAFANIGNFTIT